MIPNPIVKVLSTISFHEVQHLLMGGQACVFYGAAEFSRDCDIVLLSDEANFARLQTALDELEAIRIATPPFEIESRTPAMLIEIVAKHAKQARDVVKRRPLLGEAFAASESALARELKVEQDSEQQADKDYWAPLKHELESWCVCPCRGSNLLFRGFDRRKESLFSRSKLLKL